MPASTKSLRKMEIRCESPSFPEVIKMTLPEDAVIPAVKHAFHLNSPAGGKFLLRVDSHEYTDGVIIVHCTEIDDDNVPPELLPN